MNNHDNPKTAAAQFHYLNGGTKKPDDHGIKDLLKAQPELMNLMERYIKKSLEVALQEAKHERR